MNNKKKMDDFNQNLKKGIKPIHTNLFSAKTFGEKAADRVTHVAGSWGFIIGFLIFLGIWMIINIFAWVKVWDPYPFILLNLVLSTLAAIQAPVILMSQNRAAQKDRQRAEYDYAVNRKSAREIEQIKNQLSRIEKKLPK
jgi:uncharacterized membrane protein